MVDIHQSICLEFIPYKFYVFLVQTYFIHQEKDQKLQKKTKTKQNKQNNNKQTKNT